MPRNPKLPVGAALIGSSLAGVLVALQSRVNGGLSQQLGNGYVAAATSFSSGLLVLCLVMLLSRRGRAGLGRVRSELRAGRLRLWMLFGGAGGACFVLGQGLITPVIGLALFTVGIVAGQVLGGLVFDRAGLGPGGRIDPTPTRLIGTALAIVAVVVSVGSDEHAAREVLLVVFPVLVGAGVAAQSMVNGLVRSAAGSALTSTWINFVVGTSLLVVCAIVSVAVDGWPQNWPTSPVSYVGGVLGVVFIAIAAMLVRAAGVLLLSMSNVAGQLLASVALEAGAPLSGALTQGMIAGSALALLAVAVAAVPSRWRESER